MAPGHTMMATVNSSMWSGWTSGPKTVFSHALIETALFILIIEEVALATQRYAGIIVAVGGIGLILFEALTLKSIKRTIMKVSGGDMSESPYMAGCSPTLPTHTSRYRWLIAGSAMVL
jgi:threonine/homoserine/homoserine lactone efflux protein